jgi:hypothetical protein
LLLIAALYDRLLFTAACCRKEWKKITATLLLNTEGFIAPAKAYVSYVEALIKKA